VITEIYSIGQANWDLIDFELFELVFAHNCYLLSVEGVSGPFFRKGVIYATKMRNAYSKRRKVSKLQL
jgi:hypothetical protein